MSFLSAAFLFALPLAALPVAIHLYRGRQRDVVPWAAMQFLTVAATKGRTMERLEELALMALRLAAVAALVLALARPMIQSSWLGDGSDGDVILVLDNSLSMSRAVDGQSAADLLQRRAAEVINGLSSGQSVQVLYACGAEWATADGIRADGAGKRQLLAIVQDAKPTLGAADLRDCIQAAVHLESSDALPQRRIVVLTDDQAGSWQLEPKSAWQQLGQAVKEANFPISIDVINCGLDAASYDNLAVANLQTRQALVRPGDAIELSAEVHNAGSKPSEAATIEWLVDGKTVQSAPLAALAANGRAPATASLRMDKPGTFRVSCRLTAADQTPLDQEDAVVVEAAEQTPILVVESPTTDPKTPATSELLQAALGYAQGEPQTWHSVFRPEVIEPSELASRSLAGVRAVLIDNLPALDRASLERLDAFVRGGGGLWVGVGDRIDRDQFNADWYADGTGLSPLALAAVEQIADPDAPAAAVHPPSRAHSATAQLANTTQLDVDEGRFRERWRFADQTSSAAPASTLLESGDGRPLVVEQFVGRGRVLVQAAPLGMQWTNLPLLKSYVVMIHDGLDYITSPTSSQFNLTPGSPLLTPALDGDASAVVVTPRGREIPLTFTAGETLATYRYSQTRLPGEYRLRVERAGQPVEMPFQVKRNAAESTLAALTETERSELQSSGVQFGAEAQAVGAAREEAPRREPIWGVLLAVLAVLLAVELLVASRLARQRHGYVPESAGSSLV